MQRKLRALSFAICDGAWKRGDQPPEIRSSCHQLELICKADPALYDLPLKLSTRAPSDWKKSVVTQGSNSTQVTVRDGKAQYDALPGGRVITLKKAE